MRQSPNESKKITALYLRISREDGNQDESYSIVNQKKLLTDIAKKMKLANIKCYIDDGVTGTKLDRKSFTEMLQDIEKGLASTVIVKDLSRLSRDKSQANGGKVGDRVPHHWNSSTVVKILAMQEYCGDIINLKTYAKSSKLKTTA